MLHLVRNNSPYTVIILFIFSLVVKLQALVHPVAPVVLPDHFVFAFVVRTLNYVLGGSAFAYTMLSVILLFAQAIYLNAVVIKHKLLNKPTYVVAFLYILFTSLSPVFNYFSEPLLVNFVLIAGIDLLLGLHQAGHPRKQTFNTGFMLSIASLLYFQCIGYVILMFVALLLLRSFNVGEWVVAIIGYLTPLYFLVGILFLTDSIQLLRIWPEVGISLPKQLSAPVYTIGTITGLITLLVCGIFVLHPQLIKTSVFMRHNWTIVGFYLFAAILVAVGTDFSVKNAWLSVMPPLSIIIANAFYLEKNKGFSNFAFYFSLLLVVFCQWTYK